jgi:5-amino-6-(5-phosphoribosylamino)uracil reductase
VTQRPYVLLSVAMSVDGCIDDASDTRLILSNDADLDRVDEVRAGSDAILVGAGTIRRDNPALLVRSAARRSARGARGLPASPARVTLTASGDLDSSARFFTAGEGDRLVYVPAGEQERVRDRLAGLAGVQVVGVGDHRVDLPAVLADLAARGVRRLMVEGGGSVLAQFLADGLADELDLVVAPLFVGDPAAPRIAGATAAPPLHRMHLAEVRLIGDVVLMRYLPGPGAVRRSRTK